MPPSRRHFLTTSRHHYLTGSPYLSPSFTLNFLPLFHRHEAIVVQPLLGVCLGKKSPSRGGSRSSETSPDLVRSRQI
uniref:Uncharacterized protein n=1 Tax=Fagus sylvatica TaxID=28930 RepID=A0A2N9F920_FAGSY